MAPFDSVVEVDAPALRAPATTAPAQADTVFSLASLIAWLRTKPAEETYDYIGDCLYVQFGRANGVSYLTAIRRLQLHNGDVMWGTLAGTRPYTFGAALKRALKLQAEGVR